MRVSGKIAKERFLVGVRSDLLVIFFSFKPITLFVGRYTEDGLPIYTLEELGIDPNRGGGNLTCSMIANIYFT